MQILCSYRNPPFARRGCRRFKAIRQHSRKLISQFNIRASGPATCMGSLSGGNQQKVIISRELSREVRVLLANQPTRGLDVESVKYIHSQILNIRRLGAAILLISTEIDEIMALSDRIAVIVSGKIVAIHHVADITREQLGRFMTGTK